MAALTVKDAYGINEQLLASLATQDPAWDTAFKIWQKAKNLRFDSLTADQMHALEAIEMDAQEYEMSLVTFI
jgi:hypothetical protein